MAKTSLILVIQFIVILVLFAGLVIMSQPTDPQIRSEQDIINIVGALVGDNGTDSDGDGFSDDVEAYLGTSPNTACNGSVDTSLQSNPSLAWPADLHTLDDVASGSGKNKINLQDLITFIAPTRRLGTSPGDADYDQRWDLVPGNGGIFIDDINIQDLIAAGIAGSTAYPPMLGGAHAFNGPDCSAPATTTTTLAPTTTTTLPGSPDLIVESATATYSPSTNSISTDAIVKNIGQTTVDIVTFTSVGAVNEAPSRWEYTYQPIAPGSSKAVTILGYNPQIGDTTIEVCADHTDKVSESNENNNCIVVSFTGGPVVDQIAPSVGFQLPTDQSYGGPAKKITGRYFTYINASVYEAHSSVDRCTLEWNGVNETMAMRLRGPTYPGQEICYVNKTGLADGTYTYRVWANDTWGNLGESQTQTIEIGDFPDLVSAAVEVIGTPTVNQNLILRNTIGNNGTIAAGSSTTSFDIIRLTGPENNETFLGYKVVPLLPPGSSYAVNVSWTPTVSGTYKFFTCADNLTVVDEIIDYNNCGTSRFTVP